MLSFDTARTTILEHVQPQGIERVPLLDATGRVLAENMNAPWDLPPWDNAAMDGYAVRSQDCEVTPCRLLVDGFLPAGANQGSASVGSKRAIRIMTGAPVPRGCDAIVTLEATDNGREEVTILQPVARGQHLRLRGEEITEGTIFLHSGAIMSPLDISMLANFGFAMAPVHRRPHVAILSTGDELIELGKTPAPGQIINSNTLAIAAAVQEAGGVPHILGIARDTPESHRSLLAEGLRADVLITSAGVSAGDRDLVRTVLEELGARSVFWKINMRPGGPTAFAMYGSTPVFCLPGNPTATLITFEEFVRPALLRMQGHQRVLRPLFTARLRCGIRKKPGRTYIVQVKLYREDGCWCANPAGRQKDVTPTPLEGPTALAVLPQETGDLAAGDAINVHFFGNHTDLM